VLDIKLAQGGDITFGDTNFLNPPATTTRQGVVELATNAEAAAGTDTQRAYARRRCRPRCCHAPARPWRGQRHQRRPARWPARRVVRRYRLASGLCPFDSAGFTGAAVKSVLGITARCAAFTGVHPVAAGSRRRMPPTFGSNANGYWRKMPDGLIEQWGEVTAGESSSPALDFPIPFTDLASSICQ
jgi:hypothetical protein